MSSRAPRLSKKSSRRGLGPLPALKLALVLAGAASLAGLCALVGTQGGGGRGEREAGGGGAGAGIALQLLRADVGPQAVSGAKGARMGGPPPPTPPEAPGHHRPCSRSLSGSPWTFTSRSRWTTPGVRSAGCTTSSGRGCIRRACCLSPRSFASVPLPAMLCPHGHWKNGNAHPEVQRRCLNFARLGYVTFSSVQNHYEDLAIGVSHQTLMIWNNMRALDYLESLAEVDKTKIGVAGASGGGLQTQMLLALDDRVKAATIVGLTCDFREILFPHASHCVCNHFPGVMQYTDHPEISTLGFPTPVQYLTMNDWTRKFEETDFPTIRQLYAAGGFGDRVFCKHFSTPHSYDKEKREYTYWWMDRWLRGRQDAKLEAEPETKVFAPETLVNLAAEVPAGQGIHGDQPDLRAQAALSRPAARLGFRLGGLP